MRVVSSRRRLTPLMRERLHDHGRSSTMSFHKYLFASICLASLAVLPVRAAETAKPATSAEVRKEITEAMEAIARYSATKRDEALERANKALSELDEELEQREQKLRQRWNEMSESAQAEARETSNELAQRRRELAEWYG